MSKKKKELPQDISVNTDNFGISIAELFGQKKPENTKKEPAPTNIKTGQDKKCGKITRWLLQRQTAGRGGKVVTLVVFPKDSSVDLETLAKNMRKGLGCGSHIEENKIVLQGDISERAQAWLEREAAK